MSAAWLRRLVEGGRPSGAPDGEWVITDVARDVCDLGHIPGAVRVETDRFEADLALEPRNYWKLVPDTILVPVLCSLGIRVDTTVIVHGRPAIAAARFAWTLLHAGVRDVRMLDGGLPAWIRAGGGLVPCPAVPRPVSSFGAVVPGRPQLRATIETVRAAVGDPATVIADTRTWGEYLGARSGYEDIPAKGRIPGARWAHSGLDVMSMQDYENPDGTFRDPEEVEGFWRAWDIVPERRVIFYCGTGWRASLAFFHAYSMGWPSIQLFDGGWMEWSLGPEVDRNPVESGSKVIEELPGWTSADWRPAVRARG